MARYGYANSNATKKFGGFHSSRRVTVHFSCKSKKVNRSVIWPWIKNCHKMIHTFHPQFYSKFQGPRPFRPKIAKIAKSGQKSQHATRSVIWPRIKKCNKMIYTFHPYFCSKFQGPRPFRPKIAEIAISGQKKPARDYFGYFWSKQSGTLKFGTKVGVKSINHLMTFFDSRPNNRSGRVLAFLAWFGYFWSKRSGTLKFGTKLGVKSINHFITFFDSRPNNRAIDLFAFAAKVHCNSLRAMETPKFLLCVGIGTPIPSQFG